MKDVLLCEVNHLSFVTEVTASVQKMCYAWESDGSYHRCPLL